MNTVGARREGDIETVIHQDEGTAWPSNLKNLVDKLREIQSAQVSLSDLYEPATDIDGVLDYLQLEINLTRSASSHSLKHAVRDQVKKRVVRLQDLFLWKLIHWLAIPRR